MDRKVAELLVLKSQENYIRVLENGFKPCPLDKASVFPMRQLELVISLGHSLVKAGYRDVSLQRLTIFEEKMEEIE